MTAKPTGAFKTMAIPEEPDDASQERAAFKTMAIPEEPDDDAPRAEKSPFGKR